jgi:hypothetical protein
MILFASNATPEGRQQNLRVEMLVSGTAIGSNNPAGTNSGAQPSAVGSQTSADQHAPR